LLIFHTPELFSGNPVTRMKNKLINLFGILIVTQHKAACFYFHPKCINRLSLLGNIKSSRENNFDEVYASDQSFINSDGDHLEIERKETVMYEASGKTKDLSESEMNSPISTLLNVVEKQFIERYFNSLEQADLKREQKVKILEERCADLEKQLRYKKNVVSELESTVLSLQRTVKSSESIQQEESEASLQFVNSSVCSWNDPVLRFKDSDTSICSLPLSCRRCSYWRVKVLQGSSFTIGITGYSSYASLTSSSTYAFSTENKYIVEGDALNLPDWPGIRHNDEIVFKYDPKARTLSAHRNDMNLIYIIANIPNNRPYIVIVSNPYSSGEVIVKPETYDTFKYLFL